MMMKLLAKIFPLLLLLFELLTIDAKGGVGGGGRGASGARGGGFSSGGARGGFGRAGGSVSSSGSFGGFRGGSAARTAGSGMISPLSSGTSGAKIGGLSAGGGYAASGSRSSSSGGFYYYPMIISSHNHNYRYGGSQAGVAGIRPIFANGTGVGSVSRARKFKNALTAGIVGAVGGIAAVETGKAVLHSFNRPFPYDGRNYYLDQQYFNASSDEYMCTFPFALLVQAKFIEPTEQQAQNNGSTENVSTVTENNSTDLIGNNSTLPENFLEKMKFSNNANPKHIVWACKYDEICCGFDCCPEPPIDYSNASPLGSKSASLVAITFTLSCYLFSIKSALMP